MSGVETLVINDNNPDRLFSVFMIFVVVVIAVNMITTAIKKKRKENLEEIRGKIIRRHEQIEHAYGKEEMKKHENK